MRKGGLDKEDECSPDGFLDNGLHFAVAEAVDLQFAKGLLIEIRDLLRQITRFSAGKKFYFNHISRRNDGNHAAKVGEFSGSCMSGWQIFGCSGIVVYDCLLLFMIVCCCCSACHSDAMGVT